MINLSLSQIIKTATHTSVAAIAIVMGLSQNVKAGENSDRGIIKISQDPFNTINNISAEGDRSNATQIAQGRSGRKKKSKVAGYYGGVSGGIGFPDGGFFSNTEIDFLPASEYGNGFIGSLFGGIKFSRNISADAEFLLALGGINADDVEAAAANEDVNNEVLDNLDIEGNYSAVAFYLNPRFELPIGQSEKLNLYLSPGIGISQTNIETTVRGTTIDETESNVIDDDNRTGFSYQIKGGASYSIRNSIGIFGQIRYVSMPTVEDDTNLNDFDSLNIFSTEIGVKFSL